MVQLALPVLYALLLWWFSTGVVLFLDTLPRATFRYSLAVCGVLALAAVGGIVMTVDATDTFSAYVAFTCGLCLWGWVEMSYYMGLITGPWQRPCPPQLRGWARFELAVRTSAWHELLVIGVGCALLLFVRNEANQLAAWTFAVLWLMRWSSKLNVFLGVPNLNEEWLPETLDYLKSFMIKKPMNLLFPLSVTIATVATVRMIDAALGAAPDSFEATGCGLLAALLLLGLLEHWFLVLPLEDAALWRWALQARRSREARARATLVTGADGRPSSVN